MGWRMRRRDLVALVAATLALGSVKALAQASTHRPLIALLLGGSQATVERWLVGFPEQLNALGYVEHRDYEIEYRFADGDLGRLPGSRPSWPSSIQTNRSGRHCRCTGVKKSCMSKRDWPMA